MLCTDQFTCSIGILKKKKVSLFANLVIISSHCVNFISDAMTGNVKNLGLFPDHLSKIFSSRYLALKYNPFSTFLKRIFNGFLFFPKVESWRNLEAFSLSTGIEIFVDIGGGMEEYNVNFCVTCQFLFNQFLGAMGCILNNLFILECNAYLCQCFFVLLFRFILKAEWISRGVFLHFRLELQSMRLIILH